MHPFTSQVVAAILEPHFQHQRAHPHADVGLSARRRHHRDARVREAGRPHETAREDRRELHGLWSAGVVRRRVGDAGSRADRAAHPAAGSDVRTHVQQLLHAAAAGRADSAVAGGRGLRQRRHHARPRGCRADGANAGGDHAATRPRIRKCMAALRYRRTSCGAAPALPDQDFPLVEECSSRSRRARP